jgi:hypothetical protein
LGEIGRASPVEGEMEGSAVMRGAGGRRRREERGRTVDGAGWGKRKGVADWGREGGQEAPA